MFPYTSLSLSASFMKCNVTPSSLSVLCFISTSQRASSIRTYYIAPKQYLYAYSIPKMKAFMLSTLFAFMILAVTGLATQKPVLVTYPQGTPESILDQAKDAITAAVSFLQLELDVSQRLIYNTRAESSPMNLVSHYLILLSAPQLTVIPDLFRCDNLQLYSLCFVNTENPT